MIIKKKNKIKCLETRQAVTSCLLMNSSQADFCPISKIPGVFTQVVKDIASGAFPQIGSFHVNY